MSFNYGKQNRIYRGLLSVFLLFVILFIGRHMWTYLHQSYKTETVGKTTLTKEIALDGFFVRDEQVIDERASGVLKSNYEDGKRVREGSVLSVVYESQQDQINLQLAEEYAGQYEQLKALSSEGAVKGSRIDIIVKQISQLQSEYVAQIEAGNYSKVEDLKDALTYQLNKLQLCKGEESSYESAMEKLDARVAQLRTDSEAKGTVTAPTNGYYSSKTDGFEELTLKECEESLSVEQAQALLDEKDRTSSGIGKIVTSNYWYYCALTEQSALTEKLTEGSSVTVKFGSLNSAEYSLQLIRAEKGEDGNVLLVFKSSVMNKDFINARFEKATITMESYEGIGISKKALRFKDGEAGVYVLRGSNPLFCKVDTVYEDEDIIISRYTTDSNYVSLYDRVVVGGELIRGDGA